MSAKRAPLTTSRWVSPSVDTNTSYLSLSWSGRCWKVQEALGQGLPRKADYLDAVAPRVPPLVALVAGQVQVARGRTSHGEGGLLLRLQHLPGQLQLLYLALRAPGYRRGDECCVLGPDPVLQSCRGGMEGRGGAGGRGGGRAGHAAALPPLDSAPIWLQSGGQRRGQSECAPCFPPLSPG